MALQKTGWSRHNENCPSAGNLARQEDNADGNPQLLRRWHSKRIDDPDSKRLLDDGWEHQPVPTFGHRSVLEKLRFQQLYHGLFILRVPLEG